MAISFKKYIDITSGVGGGAGVRDRDLITRVFSTNSLIPANSFLELDSAEDVASYFGSSSEEYKRSVLYFGWVSKNITRPKKISFARFVEQSQAPIIFGASKMHSLEVLKAVVSGTLAVSIGGQSEELTGIDFSAVASFADVASTIKIAINTKSGEQFSSATVSYDAVVKRFILTGGKAEDAEISASGEVADLLGLAQGAINSNGALAQTVTDTLIASTDASNNFASFLFMSSLSDEQIKEIAEWNDTQNVMFMYLVPVTDKNADTLSALLLGYSGTTLTLTTRKGEFDEMIPGIVLAATDYAKRNSVQNYMFQQFPELTAKVTNTVEANKYDSLRVNYYGQTQTAGQNISFYQRGVMMGGASDLVDQNVYANEAWLKDTVAAQIMSLLLSVSRVPANNNGRAQLLAVIQSKINQALDNGTVSVGKALSTFQKLYIAEITGNPLAWQQVQNIGYWVDCQMQTYVTQDGRTEYKAVYTLIYSKEDAVRKVEGTHTLI